MDQDSIVVSGFARLPRGLAENYSAVVLEIEAGGDPAVCKSCSVMPAFPLLQELLSQLLVGRRFDELAEVHKQFERRYRGKIQRAVLAAIQSLSLLED